MAKQIGLQFTGRIDDYSFYHDRLHGYLVRRTGGVTSKQYKTDLRYAAARDASSEFTAVSKAGKLIRDAFGAYANQVKDGTMVNRLNKELVALKQADNKHGRGERRPETMIGNAEANHWLRIFQFNEAVKVYDLMELSDAMHRVPTRLKSSAFPEGATHAGLTLVRSVIDFEKGCFETDSSQMVLVSKSDAGLETALKLGMDTKHHSSTLGEIEIVCLQVVFYKEVNGELIQLKGKVHGMGVISVNAFRAPTRSGSAGKGLRFARRASRVFQRSITYRASLCYDFGSSDYQTSRLRGIAKKDTRHVPLGSMFLTTGPRHSTMDAMPRVPTAPA